MKELQFLREIKSVSMATIGDNKPHVRIIDIMLVEDDKVYFTTARGKAFYKQLIESEYIAITAMDPTYKSIRISGTVSKVDRSFMTKIFEANPMLNDIYPGDTKDILEPFCITKGVGEIFDISKLPITKSRFSFGGADVIPSAYKITEECIACGKCEKGCPEKAIEQGDIYKIKSSHCIECGRCYEMCPVNAIEVPMCI